MDYLSKINITIKTNKEWTENDESNQIPAISKLMRKSHILRKPIVSITELIKGATKRSYFSEI